MAEGKKKDSQWRSGNVEDPNEDDQSLIFYDAAEAASEYQEMVTGNVPVGSIVFMDPLDTTAYIDMAALNSAVDKGRPINWSSRWARRSSTHVFYMDADEGKPLWAIVQDEKYEDFTLVSNSYGLCYLSLLKTTKFATALAKVGSTPTVGELVTHPSFRQALVEDEIDFTKTVSECDGIYHVEPGQDLTFAQLFIDEKYHAARIGGNSPSKDEGSDNSNLEIVPADRETVNASDRLYIQQSVADTMQATQGAGIIGLIVSAVQAADPGRSNMCYRLVCPVTLGRMPLVEDFLDASRGMVARTTRVMVFFDGEVIHLQQDENGIPSSEFLCNLRQGVVIAHDGTYPLPPGCRIGGVQKKQNKAVLLSSDSISLDAVRIDKGRFGVYFKHIDRKNGDVVATTETIVGYGLKLLMVRVIAIIAAYIFSSGWFPFVCASCLLASGMARQLLVMEQEFKPGWCYIGTIIGHDDRCLASILGPDPSFLDYVNLILREKMTINPAPKLALDRVSKTLHWGEEGISVREAIDILRDEMEEWTIGRHRPTMRMRERARLNDSIARLEIATFGVAFISLLLTSLFGKKVTNLVNQRNGKCHELLIESGSEPDINLLRWVAETSHLKPTDNRVSLSFDGYRLHVQLNPNGVPAEAVVHELRQGHFTVGRHKLTVNKHLVIGSQDKSGLLLNFLLSSFAIMWLTGVNMIIEDVTATYDRFVENARNFVAKFRRKPSRDGYCYQEWWYHDPPDLGRWVDGSVLADLIDEDYTEVKYSLNIRVFPAECGVLIHCSDSKYGQRYTSREFVKLLRTYPGCKVGGVQARKPDFKQINGYEPTSLKLGPLYFEKSAHHLRRLLTIGFKLFTIMFSLNQFFHDRNRWWLWASTILYTIANLTDYSLNFSEWFRFSLIVAPLGTRGDHIPMMYLYRTLLRYGLPAAWRESDTEQGKRMLAYVETNQFYRGTPCFLQYGSELAHLVRESNTYVLAQHGGAGCPHRVIPVSCSPDPIDLDWFHLTEGEGYLHSMLTILGSIMFVLENPSIRIGITAGCFTRSSDGETPLVRNENQGTRGALVLTGSSSNGTYSGIEHEKGVYSQRKAMAYHHDPRIDHKNTMSDYEVVYCHGGAGTVHTALMNGCTVMSRAKILDRDMRQHIPVSPDVGDFYGLYGVLTGMMLYHQMHALLIILKRRPLMGMRLATALMFEHVFCIALFKTMLCGPYLSWGLKIIRSPTVPSLVARLLLPNVIPANNGTGAFLITIAFGMMTCRPIEFSKGCGIVLGLLGLGFKRINHPLFVMSISTLGPIWALLFTTVVCEVVIWGAGGALYFLSLATGWLDHKGPVDITSVQIEITKLRQGWLDNLPLFHWRLANPMTGETIGITPNSDSIINLVDESMDGEPAITRLNTHIPISEFEALKAHFHVIKGEYYTPVNHCQTAVVRSIWSLPNKTPPIWVILVLSVILACCTSILFTILVLIVVPPGLVYCKCTHGEFFPATFSKILTSAGADAAVLTLKGLYNYLSVWKERPARKYCEPNEVMIESDFGEYYMMHGEVVLKGDKLTEAQNFWIEQGYKVITLESLPENNRDWRAWEGNYVIINTDITPLRCQKILNSLMVQGKPGTKSVSYDCIAVNPDCHAVTGDGPTTSVWMLNYHSLNTRLDHVPTNYFGVEDDGAKLTVIASGSTITESLDSIVEALARNDNPCNVNVIELKGANVLIDDVKVPALKMTYLMGKPTESLQDVAAIVRDNFYCLAERCNAVLAECREAIDSSKFGAEILGKYELVRRLIRPLNLKTGRIKVGHAPPVPVPTNNLYESGLNLHPNPVFIDAEYEDTLRYMINCINNNISSRYTTSLSTDVQFVRAVNHCPYISDMFMSSAMKFTNGNLVEGVDGQIFACRPVMIASLARYLRDETTLNAHTDDDLRDVARSLASRNPDLYLNAIPADPKKLWAHQTKGSKAKMSAGLPLIGQRSKTGKKIKTRRDIVKAGLHHAFIEAAKSNLTTGMYLPALAHAFPKSQVVKEEKLKKSLANLRTITATSLLNNMQQLILNFDVNNRHDPYNAPGKPGLALNGFGLGMIFANCAKYKRNFSLDITKFDSQIPESILRVIWHLRCIGYETHPCYETITRHLWCQIMQGKYAHIVNLIDESPEALIESLDATTLEIYQRVAGDQMDELIEATRNLAKTHETAPGGVITKEVGGLTGDANTTFNNTTGLQAVVILAVSELTGKPIDDFFKDSDLCNTGDDNIFSTNLDVDPDELIHIVKRKFGLEMRIESTSSSVLGQTFLGKVPLRGKDYADDFTLAGIDVPEFAVMHDPSLMAMRFGNFKIDASRRMKDTQSRMEYMIEKGHGYLNLCAHQPTTYDEIKKVVDYCKSTMVRVAKKKGDSQERRAKRFIKRHPTPSYKQVLKNWYKPVDPEKMAGVFQLKMEMSWEGGATDAVTKFLQTLDAMTGTMKPHLWDVNDGDLVTARDSIDSEGLFESHIFYMFVAKNKRAPNFQEFEMNVNQSPFQSSCRPYTWYHTIGYKLPVHGVIAERNVENALWNVLIFSCIYSQTGDLIASVELVPLGVIITRLYDFTVFTLPRLFSISNYLFYLGNGHSSVILSSTCPKDPFRYQKRLALILMKLVPEIPMLSYIPVRWIFKCIGSTVEEMVDLLNIELGPSKKRQLLDVKPVDNKWSLAASKAAELMTKGEVPVITAPTGSGKTRDLPTLMLNQRVNEQRIRAVCVLMPRNILCAEYASKSKAYWLKRGNKDGGELMVSTYGFIATCVARGVSLPFDKHTLLIFDEAHEKSVEWTYLQKVIFSLHHCMMLSATPTAIKGNHPHVKVDVPTPHAIEVKEEIGRSVIDTFQDAAKQHTRILIIEPSYRKCMKIQRSLISLGYKCEMMSSKRRQIPSDKYHVVATSVVDAGITIPGIDCVIDSGWRIVNDRGELKRVPIDMATSLQRRGRTGRTCPGTYYQLEKIADVVYEPGPSVSSVLAEDVVAAALCRPDNFDRATQPLFRTNSFAHTMNAVPRHALPSVEIYHSFYIDGLDPIEEYSNLLAGPLDEAHEFLLRQVQASTEDLLPIEEAETFHDNARIYYVAKSGRMYDRLQIVENTLIGV